LGLIPYGTGDPKVEEKKKLQGLLRSFSSGQMEACPLSTLVNNVGTIWRRVWSRCEDCERR
jgi:hypothetical protein